MKLPFIQHIGIGLTIVKNTVRWVELSRIRHRVRIRRVAVELIRDGEEGPSEAIGRLVERFRPRDPRVATHLPTGHLRETVIEVPGFWDPAARDAWILRRAAELLPAGMNTHPFAIRFVPFATSERCADGSRSGPSPQRRSDRGLRRGSEVGHTRPGYAKTGAMETPSAERGLLVMARKEAIAARADLLRTAGLEPAFIGSPVPLLGRASGLDSALQGGTAPPAWILWLGGQHAALGRHIRGRLAGFMPIHRSDSPSAVLRTIEEHEAPSLGDAMQRAPRPLCIMGEGAPAWCHAAHQSESPLLDAWALRPFRIGKRKADDMSGSGAEEQNSEDPSTDLTGPQAPSTNIALGPGAGPAVAFALGLLYPRQTPANLLPPSRLEAAHQAGQRRDGLLALAGIGLVSLILMLGAIGLETYLQEKAVAAEQRMRLASRHLARVDSARTRLQRFRRRAVQLDEVTSLRTVTAPLLEHLAHAVPNGLWMEEIALHSGMFERDAPPNRTPDPLRGPRRTTVALRGWAVDADAPAQLVAALEENPPLTDVQPILIERRSQENTRQRAFEDEPIFFEVHLTAPLSAPEVNMSASELAVLQDMTTGPTP